MVGQISPAWLGILDWNLTQSRQNKKKKNYPTSPKYSA